MERAGVWRRITAHFLDLLLMMIAIALLVMIGQRHQDMEILLTPIQGALVFLYTWYYHGRTGQTLGKKWMGIRVVDDRGERIDFARSLRRNWILFVMSVPWIVATIIALLKIPPAEYLMLSAHGEAALEASLRPGWYEPIQFCVGVLFMIDLVLMLATKRRKSLHDYLGGTVVVVDRTLTKPQS
jgi:uncharacterized RDD family membrane protein YckC